MKIITTYHCPPIPDRNYDWSAMREEDIGEEKRGHVGWGKTEQEAIDDLKFQLDWEPEDFGA